MIEFDAHKILMRHENLWREIEKVPGWYVISFHEVIDP